MIDTTKSVKSTSQANPMIKNCQQNSSRTPIDVFTLAMPKSKRIRTGHSTVTWYEYKERIPLRSNDVNFRSLQTITDIISEHENIKNTEKNSPDLQTKETHILTSSRTFGKELLNISIVVDYIPKYLLSFLLIVFFYIYGPEDDFDLTYNTTKVIDMTSTKIAKTAQ